MSKWTPVIKEHSFGNGWKVRPAINIKFRNLPLTPKQMDLAYEIYGNERHYWLISSHISHLVEYWNEEFPNCKMWRGGRSGGWLYIDDVSPDEETLQAFKEVVSGHVLDWRDHLQECLDGDTCIYGYDTSVEGVNFLAYPHRIDLHIYEFGVVYSKECEDLLPDITGSVATKMAWDAAVNLLDKNKDEEMDIYIAPHDGEVCIMMWYGANHDDEYIARIADDVLDIPGEIYEMCLLAIKSELEIRRDKENGD